MASPQYGAQPQRFGYGYAPAQPVKPVAQRGLAAAAAGRPTASDPFGLSSEPGGSNGTNPYFLINPIPAATPQAPSSTPGAPPSSTPQTPSTTPDGISTTAPTVGSVFDINTAPAVQSANALTGLNEADARSSALTQKQQALLGFGDAGLAAKVLGAGDPFVQAAAQNPNSTSKQLGQGYNRNIHDLTEGLNKQNLAYSGYRVTQEQQAAQDYQNALANAAAQVNGTLGGIDSQLGQALSLSRSQRIQALNDSYAQNKLNPGVGAAATAAPLDTSALGGGGGGGAGSDDYRTLLALAAAARKPINA